MQYGKPLSLVVSNSSVQLMCFGKPSAPVMPNPSSIFCVSLNGTLSGTSSVFPCLYSAPEPNAYEGYYLFKQAVEVNMNNTSRIRVQQDVLAMSISESMANDLELT